VAALGGADVPSIQEHLREVIMREALSGLMLPGWDRRSIYGWSERDGSWYAQLWRNDQPDDPVADAPHIGLGPLYGQQISQVSHLIHLIARATGYDFDIVDQVMLAGGREAGDRLRLYLLPDWEVHEGICRSSSELQLDNGEVHDLWDLAERAARGEVRIGLSDVPEAAS
jgi:hypothetical protein